MIRHLLAACMLLLLAAPAQAQLPPTATHVAATLVSEADKIASDSVFWVALHLTMEEGWHTYWQNPGDSGLATRIDWQLPVGFSAGAIHWPAPERIAIGDLMNYGYEKEVYLLVPITTPKDMAEENTFTATANWLACKDVCIPESAMLNLTLPKSNAAVPGASAGIFASLVQHIPVPFAGNASFTAYEDKIMLAFPREGALAQAGQDITFFPIDNGVMNNASAQKVSISNNFIHLTMERVSHSEVPEQYKGVVTFTAGNALQAVQVTMQREQATSSAHMPDLSFSIALWFALLGGLILNIMPCVLPVLSLKAVDLAKKSGTKRLGVLAQGIAYTLGIQISFALLTLILILLQHGGQMAGWGYQLQSPWFVTILIYVIFAVGLNLSGMFELPVIAGDLNHKASRKESWAGSFFAGMLATLVATPCTAPFMAPAIGYAFTLPPIQSFLIFQALGLGLALPYLLISIFPATLKLLPKPGQWMESFKQFLAFPMYATAVWLMWVLAQQAGANAMVIALFGCVWIGFGLWMWRKMAARGTFVRFAWLMLVIAVATSSISTLSAVQKRPDSCITEMQQAQTFSEAKLKELRDAGTPVFVDVTAAWCITCQINERTALSSPAVLKAFTEKHIVYLKADWTNKDAAITHYLESFGRGGVPLYVYYPPRGEPIVLPQLLTESKILETIK